MFLLERWKSWRATPVAMRHMLIEAALELLRARLVVAFRLKQTLPALLIPSKSGDSLPPVSLRRDIRQIFNVAAPTVPWRSVCLPNAIAAKRMFARRGYSSTLRLGVGTSPAGAPHAHAWLEAGDFMLLGEEGMANITALPTSGLRANDR